MASPQKENGYTPIAHEVMRALVKQNFSAHRWRVLMVLLMDSWGRSRKDTIMSLAQIASICGLPYNRVSEALRDLEYRKIVRVPTLPENRYSIGIHRYFQKDYDQWALPEKRTVPEKRESSLPQKRESSRTRAVTKAKQTTP